ncbi:MFS transporter [Paraburkholderia phenazinium]|uniref:Predicted arabinose efflux permease, MFS family n=1 Tax=Paraburkholderia phenazinium TaxID=60549 RepID=A0A1G8AXG2_9BURK|nr:MFS transporter [Paraburkholderia phenazinium]SDH25651.1 Predicted arabinose efflux permease, MFS family [Paraburkholderia phenazinium]
MKPANDSWARDAAAGLSSAQANGDDEPALDEARTPTFNESVNRPVAPLIGGTLQPPAHAAEASQSAHPAQPAGATATVSSLQATAILLLGYAILITGNGLLGTLISLRLIQQQTPSLVVGVVQSAYYVGFMVGALWGGGLIGRVGHHRAFVTFAAVSACCALGYATWSSAATWVALRFVMGFCLVGIFTVVESWLHQVASNAQRGRVFSAYLITNYLGVGTGQFLIGLADPAGFALFSLVSALFSASLIPVALAGNAPIPPAPAETPGSGAGSRLARGLSGLSTVYKWAPLGVYGCLAAGLLNSGFYTLQPVFMRRLGYSVTDVSHFMGFALLAALLPQWPVARLADLFDRRIIITAITALAAACSLLLFLLPGGTLVEVLGYVYVSVVFSLYGVVTSYVNDCIPAEQRIAVSAGLLLIFSLGASAGPTLASALMALAGPGGLYLFTTLVTCTLAALTLSSLRTTPRVTR